MPIPPSLAISESPVTRQPGRCVSRNNGTFGTEMWSFVPHVYDHPIAYGEEPGDRVRSTQDGGALELEVGASYFVGDCVFRYLGSRVERLTPRRCGQARKPAPGRRDD